MSLQEYSTLKKGSKDKLVSVMKRLESHGLTSKEALQLSDTQLKQRLKFEGKEASFSGLKRNIKQIDGKSTNYSRAEPLLKDFSKKEKTFQAKRRAYQSGAKVIGHNRFFNGVNAVQKKNPNLSKRQAQIITASIIKKAKTRFKKLSKAQKQIIQAISP